MPSVEHRSFVDSIRSEARRDDRLAAGDDRAVPVPCRQMPHRRGSGRRWPRSDRTRGRTVANRVPAADDRVDESSMAEPRRPVDSADATGRQRDTIAWPIPASRRGRGAPIARRHARTFRVERMAGVSPSTAQAVGPAAPMRVPVSARRHSAPALPALPVRRRASAIRMPRRAPAAPPASAASAGRRPVPRAARP